MGVDRRFRRRFAADARAIPVEINRFAIIVTAQRELFGISDAIPIARRFCRLDLN